jgi:aspartate racemase
MSMQTTENHEIWGILGGMGPLASAEFVSSIYRETFSGREQQAPRVLLLSDPTIPDRTECLLNGDHEMLLERLAAGVGQLVLMGATRIVICCMTIHPLVPRLPSFWQRKIISLLDSTLNAVLVSHTRHLMVCTTGTRRLRLFEQHPLWPEVKNRIVFPAEEDQQRIHQLLYGIKGQEQIGPLIALIEELLEKYGVHSYIAGCTEMHILAKAHENLKGRSRREFCIDPLTEILFMMQPRAEATMAF